MNPVLQYQNNCFMRSESVYQCNSKNPETLEPVRLLTAGLQVQVLPLEPFFTPPKQGFSENKPTGKPSQLYPNCNRFTRNLGNKGRIIQNKKPATGVFTPAQNAKKI